MPRGGRRTGTPGKAYSNRADLNQTRTLPVQAPPSQQYGQAAAAIRSQQAVPMAAPAAPSATRSVAPAQATPPAPGSLGPLDAPTARPGEPVTAPPPATAMPDGIDPDLASLARQLPMLELMASQPNASVAARNWVRRLRGMIPPNLQA